MAQASLRSSGDAGACQRGVARRAPWNARAGAGAHPCGAAAARPRGGRQSSATPPSARRRGSAATRGRARALERAVGPEERAAQASVRRSGDAGAWWPAEQPGATEPAEARSSDDAGCAQPLERAIGPGARAAPPCQRARMAQASARSSGDAGAWRPAEQPDVPSGTLEPAQVRVIAEQQRCSRVAAGRAARRHPWNARGAAGAWPCRAAT